MCVQWLRGGSVLPLSSNWTNSSTILQYTPLLLVLHSVTVQCIDLLYSSSSIQEVAPCIKEKSRRQCYMPGPARCWAKLGLASYSTTRAQTAFNTASRKQGFLSSGYFDGGSRFSSIFNRVRNRARREKPELESLGGCPATVCRSPTILLLLLDCIIMQILSWPELMIRHQQIKDGFELRLLLAFQNVCCFGCWITSNIL
jgi:hypothetical protein